MDCFSTSQTNFPADMEHHGIYIYIIHWIILQLPTITIWLGLKLGSPTSNPIVASAPQKPMGWDPNSMLRDQNP